MLVLQGGGQLNKGEYIFNIDTFFLHLLAMCAQQCMKGRREEREGRGKGTKKAGRERENNNDNPNNKGL